MTSETNKISLGVALGLVLVLAPGSVFAESVVERRRAVVAEIESLLAKAESSGWLGFYTRHTEGAEGHETRIVYVYAQSPAERAGLEVGDRLLKLGEIDFSGADARSVAARFQHLGRSLRPGQNVPATVERDGEAIHVTLEAAGLEGHSLSEFIGREMLILYGESRRQHK